MRNPVTRLCNAVKAVRAKFDEPLRLELSLVDHCNLNCKGCTHYCPIAPRHLMPVAEVEACLSHLAGVDSSMFSYIYLLGGEPLLHPDIAEVCHLVRRYFPTVGIKLLTNGLLVDRMDDAFWAACRDTDTVLSVTIYPVKVDYDRIEALCRENGVRYEVFHQPKEGRFFSKHVIDDVNPGSRHVNFLRCHELGCLTLRDGKIYPCATSAYAGLVNEAFGRRFEHTAPREGRRGGDYVEVTAVKSRADLSRLKERPTPFCRYCTRIEPTEWAPSRRDPSEWL
ncbi:MAG: radical SAM protein [Muribaculaceae bacterium]|nr:radical SAM protein [Muribaculaceae bacterium]